MHRASKLFWSFGFWGPGFLFWGIGFKTFGVWGCSIFCDRKTYILHQSRANSSFTATDAFEIEKIVGTT